MIMKGEKPLAWALRIDNEGELADLETLKPQEIKLMKLFQGLKAEDRLYDLITEMDPKGWEQAKVIIRKHTAIYLPLSTFSDIFMATGYHDG